MNATGRNEELSDTVIKYQWPTTQAITYQLQTVHLSAWSQQRIVRDAEPLCTNI